MIRFNELEVDENERPLDPPTIHKTEVYINLKIMHHAYLIPIKIWAILNFAALSFAPLIFALP